MEKSQSIPWLAFLMYRVELKVYLSAGFYEIKFVFLMYRVELKGVSNYLFQTARCEFLMYRVELKATPAPAV